MLNFVDLNPVIQKVYFVDKC